MHEGGVAVQSKGHQMQDPDKFRQLLDNHDVMGKILRLCRNPDQQAAYKACKAMRDVCRLNMKTVETTAEVVKNTYFVSRQATRLCPEGASNIKSLHIICKQQYAFRHLGHLLDAQHEQDRLNHHQQLATVTELHITLEVVWVSDWPSKCVARLLDLTPNVKSINANCVAFTALIGAAHQQCAQIQSLVVDDIQPEHFQQMPTVFPSMLNLCVKYVTKVVLPPQLAQLTHLEKLQLDICRLHPTKPLPPDTWAPLAGLIGLKHLCLNVRCKYTTRLTLGAGCLTVLTQLHKLELDGCTLSEPALLASMPSITHLTLDMKTIPEEEEDVKQTTSNQPRWPALQQVQLVRGATESVMQALRLPEPHPGLQLLCDERFTYSADKAADTRMGFLGVRYLAAAQTQHMYLNGNFAAPALQAMSQEGIPLRKLSLYEKVSANEVSGLNFPDLKELHVHLDAETLPLEVFYAIPQTFPNLSKFQIKQARSGQLLHNLTAGGRRFAAVGMECNTAMYHVESIM